MTYFLADCHLGASYVAHPREHEMRLVDFLNRAFPAGNDCSGMKLYLLGDILDFWWEYRQVVPRGFARFFGTLARVADQGVEITWLKGNHDIWIDDYLPREIGFTLHDGPLITQIEGRTFFLEHGDGVGQLPRAFKKLRALFRNKTAIKGFGMIHPRWGMAMAHAWSGHSRKAGGYVMDVDPAQNPLVQFAEQYATEHPGEIDYFIFGHQHRALDMGLKAGGRLIILGDWFGKESYARFDNGVLDVK